MKCSPPRDTAFRARLFFVVVMAGALASAARAQEKPLPPAAHQTVDFTQDIQPIFQNSCLRCHGPEKPRSHFRLDNRTSALTGGDSNTNDIVPGDSGKSLLVHYTSYVVQDMEMPPVGKGDPLTPHQIGLLRAWIDQGANWGTNRQPNSSIVKIATTAGGFDVQGNKAKFRELEGVTDGFRGGLEKFSLTQKIGPDEKMSLDGHLLEPEQDISLKLALDKTDLGFVHAGFEQWRKYYSTDDGYDPAVTPQQFTSNRDLHLDNGRAWVDFGLDLPHWPQMVLGYEYQYRNGNESTLDWGAANGKNIYPATQGVDEATHILKFEVTHDLIGWHLQDSTRIEFYKEKNQDAEAVIAGQGIVPNLFINTRDDYHQVQGMNTLMVERAIRDWWLLSGGFYYS